VGEWNFVWAAYALTWAVLTAYAVYVTRRAFRAQAAARLTTKERGR
jgi:hypothetical protein